MSALYLPRAIVAVALLAAAVTACSADETAPARPALPAGVGPAPLRRMSNDEYLNALRDLFPSQAPVLPPLPHDTASAGFENAAEAQQPSDVRISRYETIANLYAKGATEDGVAVAKLIGCTTDWSTPTKAAACASTFIDTVGTRLFRRPLAADERERFTLRFQAWQASIDFEAAVRLTLSAMLQAPQFLYRPEPAGADASSGVSRLVPVEPHAMASRLSFFLWESVPDDALVAAASRGELETEEQIRAEAERMLQDERARRVLWSFHRQWLGLDRVLGDEHLVRTPEVDPAWTAATPVSAAIESRLFVENVLFANGSLRDLLTSRRAWVNGDMARIYGVAAPADPAAWSEALLPETERAGILTRVAFLAGHSHRGATSPPIRGNGLQLRFFCQPPAAPPPGVDLSQPKADPKQGPQTNRMLFEARTAPSSCQGCHQGLNGLGFGFERYGAGGRYQTAEQGLTVDAHGRIYGTDIDRTFDGAIELSSALDESPMVHRCATQQWMRYALGRGLSDEEAPLADALSRNFEQSGGNVRGLLLDIVTAPTFRMRRVGN